MPVLPAEPDVFPEDLFVDGCAAHCPTRKWWVLHARPRQEKCLGRQIRANHVPFYLPLVTERRRNQQGRSMTSYLPLFPGYAFLFADPDERLVALSTHRVVRVLD